ncbi:MAG: hypothetical protein RJB47_1405 [Pseudomonadota bacterium]
MTNGKVVRIGGASGFWGDSSVGAPQLVQSGLIDFLVFDYLAETTMAILAAARAKQPEMGYATDFVDIAMKSVLPEVMKRGIKVVANAGGINPEACAKALQALAASQGLQPRIAVVLGDDISSLLPSLREQGCTDMFSSEPLPEKVLSANAYLGAWPIAQALNAGADIVITGRCVDSATTLGPLIHAFGWKEHDLHQLAGGSLAGHIIECGCQATGGLHTDWQAIPDWHNIGYPIVDCQADGSFVLHKPPGTGGKVLRAAVAEQLLYEIGDPSTYVLPDVVCDFRQVQIEQVDADHVRVSGALGRAPTDSFKVSATSLQGYRCTGSMVIIGIDAAAKAQRTGEAVLQRCRGLLAQAGLADFTSTHIDLFGAETLYGQHARTAASREVMVRITASHSSRQALDVFAREIAPSGTSWSPGTTGPGVGRPSASPLIKPFAFLLPKAAVQVRVHVDGQELDGQIGLLSRGAESLPGLSATPVWPVARLAESSEVQLPVWAEPAEPQQRVRLIQLAWARSGDKGDMSNIGVVARRPEWLPLLWDRLTPEVVQAYFQHLVHGRVERFHLPGISAINYLLHQALDGGGPASSRIDPLGKGMAQMLLDIELLVPASVAAQLV